MAGVIGKVLFTKWTSNGFGRELNWHGNLLNRALTRSTAGPSRAEATAPVAQVSASPVAAPLELDLLFDPKSNRVAMKGEVTIGQMRQFVQETGYAPAEGSHNAADFNRLITEGDASSPMVFTNEADCLAFIGWAKPLAQASDPRIQTLGLPSDSQWVDMRQTFRGQQTGSNWERLSDNSFRSFFFVDRYDIYFPELRFNGGAFRLVGTYKN